MAIFGAKEKYDKKKQEERLGYVKSICYSCRRPGFSSKHLHGGVITQYQLTQNVSSRLYIHQAGTWCTEVHAGKALVNIK